MTVTRSHKLNDRDHAGLADGTATADQHLPRYFGKTGYADADPKKTKKDGAGRANWGRDGDEMQDYGYNFTNARRRSNSSTQALGDFKTKFETVEPEPVFEEDIHGAMPADEDNLSLTKGESTNSSITDTVSEEEGHGKSV